MKTHGPILVLVASLTLGHIASAAPMTTREKLDTIILPKVQFEDAPLSTVLKYLKQRSKELDPERKGVNFILHLSPASRKAKVAEKKRPQNATAGNAEKSKPAPTRAKAAASSDVRVTMDFDNMPLGALINYMCKGTGYKHRVEKHAVIVSHPAVALDRMETRIFPVGPGFLDPKRTR